MNKKELRINENRFTNNFNSLSQIGATSMGGVNRPAFSADHLAARAWFREKVNATGLGYRMDTAGNQSAILTCKDPNAPTLLLGSHLDSVPDGGRFDGALGVVAALEALLTIQDDRVELPINLEAIALSDEEGCYIGFLGSRSIVGDLTLEDFNNTRADKHEFLDALTRAGLEKEGFLTAARDPNRLAGYLELHIEQGSRLVDKGVKIGIVTAIVGIANFRITFIGRADHSGTTPIGNRLDAGLGAGAFLLASRRLVLEEFPDCVTNVGKMEFQPGAFNITPEKAILALEFRAPNPESFRQLETAMLALAQREADDRGLGLRIEVIDSARPVLMDDTAQTAIKKAAASLSLKAVPISSYAGHDAQSLAAICPAGMIFIPSIDGASHSYREFSIWEDCIDGANTLLRSALNFIDSVA